ncbi:hypothetical protein JCM10213_000228 [Rhodosporidiobolus nylandii]
MSLPFRVVDAFTSSPFSGNPAAIVLFEASDRRADDSTFMLNLAREFRHQETAFLVPLSSPSTTSAAEAERETPSYGLRWFTPTVEFPLCGHATLASAHFLFSEHHPTASRLRFETKMSGSLFASRLEDERIELDFPADVSVVQEVDAFDEEHVREKLVEMSMPLEKAVVKVARGKLGWIIELEADYELETAVLDTAPLKTIDGYFMFSQSAKDRHPGFDIYSRVFDPLEPNPEDTVTGSAHCMLAPYYLSVASSRLPSPEEAGKRKTLRAKQGGVVRHGELEVQWDVESWRVKLRGTAVTVMEGVLRL